MIKASLNEREESTRQIKDINFGKMVITRCCSTLYPVIQQKIDYIHENPVTAGFCWLCP